MAAGRPNHSGGAMKLSILFYTFLVVFALTAIVTLLGVLGAVPIKPVHLNLLLGAFLVELAVAVIGLFKRTDFFAQFAQKDTSLTTSLGLAVDGFDRLSDEIEAAINNQPQPSRNRAHRFVIQRIGKNIVAYQKMQEFSEEHFDQLPSDVQRQIRTYKDSMKTLEERWDEIKRKHAGSQLESTVRDEQLALIKAMKADLVGIVDVLQVAGFYANDHYLTVRSLVLQL